MKNIIVFLILSLVMHFSFAQLPENYKHVDQMIWVVKDLEKIMAEWKKLGFHQIINYGDVNFTNQKYKNETVDIPVKVALAKLGNAKVTWIQPYTNDNAFGRFLKDHGDGGFSLVHKFESLNEYQKEKDRLAGLGIDILQEGVVASEKGDVHYSLMDTYENGKYVLGLMFGPDLHLELTGQAPFNARFSQYAFAIDQPHEVSEYWQKIGFPEMKIDHPSVRNKQYYGKDKDFAMDLGWQRHGDIPYEWCIPVRDPTVYRDHIDKRGEGIQHLGFNVENMDKVIADWTSLGYSVSQSGGWGEEGKPGSGRFAYIDTDKAGGVTIELLWSYKNK